MTEAQAKVIEAAKTAVASFTGGNTLFDRRGSDFERLTAAVRALDEKPCPGYCDVCERHCQHVDALEAADDPA